jgi:hypothetical protein
LVETCRILAPFPSLVDQALAVITTVRRLLNNSPPPSLKPVARFRAVAWAVLFAQSLARACALRCHAASRLAAFSRHVALRRRLATLQTCRHLRHLLAAKRIQVTARRYIQRLHERRQASRQMVERALVTLPPAVQVQQSWSTVVSRGVTPPVSRFQAAVDFHQRHFGTTVQGWIPAQHVCPAPRACAQCTSGSMGQYYKSGARLCPSFSCGRRCRNPDCRFLHALPPPPESPERPLPVVDTETGVCLFFMLTGCTYPSCYYQHLQGWVIYKNPLASPGLVTGTSPEAWQKRGAADRVRGPVGPSRGGMSGMGGRGPRRYPNNPW